jgi:CheY-like chemotaxis protein
VRLPDATGTEHLRAALRAAASTGGTAVVAVSRDPDDEKLALDAGVVHHLRKPFEALPMERLFARLGIPLRGARA